MLGNLIKLHNTLKNIILIAFLLIQNCQHNKTKIYKSLLNLIRYFTAIKNNQPIDATFKKRKNPLIPSDIES